MDETYVKVAGNTRAARRFFTTVIDAHGVPAEVLTDRAPALRAAIDELMPAAFHNTEQYANNRIECDHGRLKARLRPTRGIKRDRSARHYELGIDTRAHRRVAAAFTELAHTI